MKIQFVLTATSPKGESHQFRLDVKTSQGGTPFVLVDWLPPVGASRFIGSLNMGASRWEDSLVLTPRTGVDARLAKIAKWAVFMAAPWYEGWRGPTPKGYKFTLKEVQQRPTR